MKMVRFRAKNKGPYNDAKRLVVWPDQHFLIEMEDGAIHLASHSGGRSVEITGLSLKDATDKLEKARNG